MSAVIYDLGYDIRMIKTSKNIVTVRLLASIKEKQLRKLYALNSVTTSCSTADKLICDHGIEPFLKSFLSFYI